jgi:hypothetical protein
MQLATFDFGDIYSEYAGDCCFFNGGAPRTSEGYVTISLKDFCDSAGGSKWGTGKLI